MAERRDTAEGDVDVLHLEEGRRGRLGHGTVLGGGWWGFLGGAARGECGDSIEGVLLAASVGRALSPSASVVVLHRSDFLAYFC